jgi:hypothetical protein
LVSSDGGSSPFIGGRASGGYLVVDMAPVGGTGVTGGRAAGGRIIGGRTGEGGKPPLLIGGRGGTGGSGAGGVIGDGGSYPFIGGSGGAGGSAGFVTGGVDPAPGGMAGSNAGRSGAGGVSPAGGLMGDGGSYPWIGGSAGRAIGGMVVDCAPIGGTAISASVSPQVPAIVDPAPSDPGSFGTSPGRGLLEHWRDTTPKRTMRSSDLALFDPPVITLESRVDGDRVEVRLCGGEPTMSIRWESSGTVTGEDREVVWQPASAEDALCVAVRSRAGVAVATLRASEVGQAPSPLD